MIKFAEVKRIRDTLYGLVRLIDERRTLPHGDGRTILFVLIDGISPEPQAGWYYTYETGVFSETDPGVPAAPAVPIPQHEIWFNRMTHAERGTAWLSMYGEAVTGVRFDDEIDRGRLLAWAHLESTDPDETAWAVNIMEQAGILEAGRAAEILV